MKRALWSVVALAALGLAAWWRFGPVDPTTILAGIDVPPSPVLSAEQELASFRLAPGFRAELVAAEPLVVDPVAMDWDDQGRLFVVEMRGFMPNIDGLGEDQRSGRIVVLEDLDRDGRMDESHVYLDGLVMPRAIAVLPEGVLIGVPPDLLLCRDTNHDLRCQDVERSRVLDYASEPGNVEHNENGLLQGLDGWLYNAKSARRFRRVASAPTPDAPREAAQDDAPHDAKHEPRHAPQADPQHEPKHEPQRDPKRESEQSADSAIAIEVEPTVFRGQWGIAQDDTGRLYYNHNSAFLFADFFPAEYLLRQPASAAATTKPGINVDLASGEQVFGVRVAPGLNRAYQAGTLRRDGRQAAPTAVSGIAIQRGHQFGDAYIGDAFVPESAGSAVAHFEIEEDAESPGLRATHRLYPDEDYGQREFLASTDERFRPVDAKVGPDGAIWIIDMYRGVIQHTDYVSDYLRDYVDRHDLAPPGATGRIWRIVREDRLLEATPPRLERLEEQLAGLDHPNGWVRDRAQRRLVHSRDPAAHDRLRRLSNVTPLGKQHALWTLALRGEFEIETFRRALTSENPDVRRLALRLGETLLHDPVDAAVVVESVAAVRREALRALEQPGNESNPRLRLQALHTLGSLPAESRPLAVLLESVRTGHAIERQAGLSGLTELEEPALDAVVNAAGPPDVDWISAVTTAAFMQAQSDMKARFDTRARPDAKTRLESFQNRGRSISHLLDRIVAARSQPEGETIALALVDGIRVAQELPGSERIMLDKEHPIFETDPTSTLGEAVLRMRRGFTWEGDPRPGGARALDSEEERLRVAGARLYAATCATCHGPAGRGNKGLAPPLAGSPWVRDADDWLVRIALQGVQGPIRVGEESFDASMPGHAHDPRFDDAGLAGLLTFLRRAWGHADEPISPRSVARIRVATQDHPDAWTVDELLALPVAHRLDRYVGVYRIPIVGIEISITRAAGQLEIGRSKGSRAAMSELGDGLFRGEGMQVRFDPTESGMAQSAQIQFGSDSVTVSRAEP